MEGLVSGVGSGLSCHSTTLPCRHLCLPSGPCHASNAHRPFFPLLWEARAPLTCCSARTTLSRSPFQPLVLNNHFANRAFGHRVWEGCVQTAPKQDVISVFLRTLSALLGSPLTGSDQEKGLLWQSLQKERKNPETHSRLNFTHPVTDNIPSSSRFD